MKKTLDESLCHNYPELFAQRHYPMTETCMCWGFECGDGWYKLLDKLCYKITAYCKYWGYQIPQVMQVKEKFGTLRFYIGGTHRDAFEDIHQMIDEAERESGQTCEKCGAPGETNRGGWLSTRCGKCRE